MSITWQLLSQAIILSVHRNTFSKQEFGELHGKKIEALNYFKRIQSEYSDS